MKELSMDVHMVWMKVMKDLKTDSNVISETQDVKKTKIFIYDIVKKYIFVGKQLNTNLRFISILPYGKRWERCQLVK
jgi:hypothetical protein